MNIRIGRLDACVIDDSELRVWYQSEREKREGRSAGTCLELQPGGYVARVSVSAEPLDHESFAVSAALPLLGSVHLATSALGLRGLARRLCPDGERHDASVYVDFHSECIDGPVFGWNLWRPTFYSGPNVSTPRHGSVFPLALLFGEAKCASRAIGTVNIVRSLGGIAHRFRVTMEEYTYTRARWPGTWLRMTRGNVEPQNGEPQGYEFSAPAKTVEEALDNFLLTMRRDYRKHGWTPEQRP